MRRNVTCQLISFCMKVDQAEASTQFGWNASSEFIVVQSKLCHVFEASKYRRNRSREFVVVQIYFLHITKESKLGRDRTSQLVVVKIQRSWNMKLGGD